MAFFRTVSMSDLMPVIRGEGVMLRLPQVADWSEWAALREASRDFLTPWEPIWPTDDLTRSSFRRRIKRYFEDHRGTPQSRGQDAKFTVTKSDRSTFSVGASNDYDLLPAAFRVGSRANHGGWGDRVGRGGHFLAAFALARP